MDNNNETNNNGTNNNGYRNGYGNNNHFSRNDNHVNSPKRLYRSNMSKMLCGVCGGIGNYFNVDPTIVRLLFVLAVFFGFGSGIFVYFVLAVIVPDSPYKE